MFPPLGKFGFAFSYVYLCMRVCVHECRCPKKPKALDVLDLESQVVVSGPTWVLGADLWFSERAIMHLKYIGMNGGARYIKTLRHRKACTGELLDDSHDLWDYSVIEPYRTKM